MLDWVTIRWHGNLGNAKTTKGNWDFELGDKSASQQWRDVFCKWQWQKSDWWRGA